MLRELRIENFAIIDRLELVFGDGLATFTGETGAGKSILLDAIEALIGGRAEATMIRSGAERANLEARFAIPAAHREVLHALLDAEGLLDDAGEVLFNREIRREGRNLARINGRVVNVSLMREAGAYLVDIHGQSEHLSLLSVRQHGRLLDRFADDAALLADYQGKYEELKTLQSELDELRRADQDAARVSDLLTYQIQEIEAAKLQPGEEDELRTELSRLANAEKLSSLAREAAELLEGSSPEAPAASDMLAQVAAILTNLAGIDASLQECAAQSETAMALVEDISRELRAYGENIEFNPRRLEQVETRLALIHTLKKKYGNDEHEILAFAGRARDQLERLTNAGERIAELEAGEERLVAALAEKAVRLSDARREAARTLGERVEGELAELRMAGAQFRVETAQREAENGLPMADARRLRFDERGIDQVEFLIAPNPGEGLKPLVKIASGGETSRLMLALKNVLAAADTIPTLIFDEIDQGIGGRVGALVGEKLWRLGHHHQVLCVTHLPQLAAFGEQHFHVFKQVQAGRTSTIVEELNGERREAELALMFGGESAANRAAAGEALENARTRKASA
jgi:DNA repair protein RecN (Recombination protein N)